VSLTTTTPMKWVSPFNPNHMLFWVFPTSNRDHLLLFRQMNLLHSAIQKCKALSNPNHILFKQWTSKYHFQKIKKCFEPF
jgi:hypothetical protein